MAATSVKMNPLNVGAAEPASGGRAGKAMSTCPTGLVVSTICLSIIGIVTLACSAAALRIVLYQVVQLQAPGIPLSVASPNAGCLGMCNVNMTTSYQKVDLQAAVFEQLLGRVGTVPNTAGDPTLYAANAGPINGLQSLLCNYTAATGAVATIFQTTAPNTYTRIVTTLKDTNGKYATCTQLATTSPAYTLMGQQKKFIGQVTLFGRAYYAVYDPMIVNGQTIGIYFIGVPL